MNGEFDSRQIFELVSMPPPPMPIIIGETISSSDNISGPQFAFELHAFSFFCRDGRTFSNNSDCEKCLPRGNIELSYGRDPRMEGDTVFPYSYYYWIIYSSNQCINRLSPHLQKSIFLHRNASFAD